MSDIPHPNNLYTELKDQLEDDDVESIKAYLRNNPLTPKELQQCKTFPEICQRLEGKMKIKPDEDDYSFLEHLFEVHGKLTLKDMVTNFAAKCRRYRSSFQASRKRKVDQSTEPKSPKKRKSRRISGRNPKPSVNVQAQGSATQTGNFGNIQKVKNLTINQYPSSKQAARAQPKKKHAGGDTTQEEQAASGNEDSANEDDQ